MVSLKRPTDLLAAVGVGILLLPILLSAGAVSLLPAVLLVGVYLLVVKGIPWVLGALQGSSRSAARSRSRSLVGGRDGRRWE